MRPEEWFVLCRNKVKRPCAVAFFSTILIGLLAHMYKFTNHLPNWDSLMVHYYPIHNMIHQGRHLQLLSAAVRGFSDAPWVIGLLCFCYLGLAAALLVDFFEFRGNLCIILLCGIVVTSSVVTSGFGFLYMADAFCVAYLFAVLSVYLTKKYRYGFLIGAFCLAFSLGNYQAYLPVAIAIILLWSMVEILKSEDGRLGKRFWSIIGRFLLMGCLGMVLYAFSLKLLLFLEKTELIGHQGMGSMHFPSLSLLGHAVINAYVDTAYFYFGSLRKPSFYGVLNMICLGCLGYFAVRLIIRKKLYKQVGKLMLLAICTLVYPCVSHLFYFVTDEVQYHALMQFSLILIYVLLFWLYEYSGEKHNPVYWLTAGGGVLLIYVMIIAANRGYLAQTMSYEKTYAMVERMVVKMEQLPDYRSATKLAMLGNVEGTDKAVYGEEPALAGYTDGIFITHQKHMIAMLEEYFDVSLQGASKEEMLELSTQTDVEAMPCWPDAGSIIQIGDTIVCKVSEE